MHTGEILAVRGDEVAAALHGREREVMETIAGAYLCHAAGLASMPASACLRLPSDATARIMALPAFVGGERPIAGIKWIASFPRNLQSGMDRASAVIVLNSPSTGVPEAIMEGTLVSAQRTAAGAALAAQRLLTGERLGRAAVIGCGPINFEVVRFLRFAFPEQLTQLTLFDTDPMRSARFAQACASRFDGLACDIAPDCDTALRRSRLVSIATNAVVPHIVTLDGAAADAVVLHMSLRDLEPKILLESNNIVDDVAHVCSASTSVHLAQMRVGHCDFVNGTLADLVRDRAALRLDPSKRSIFSPFGLGVLDVALAERVRAWIEELGMGTVLPSFLPPGWGSVAVERSEPAV